MFYDFVENPTLVAAHMCTYKNYFVPPYCCKMLIGQTIYRFLIAFNHCKKSWEITWL